MDRNAFWALLADWTRSVAAKVGHRPALVGLSAPQGAGKTTMTRAMVQKLAERNVRAMAISIDDFYLTHAEQSELGLRYPNNPYLQHRGLPGTHDIKLGCETLRALKSLNRPHQITVPSYDRSAHGGRGDRRPVSAWPKIEGPLDVAIVEGWMLGFSPLGPAGPSDIHLGVVDDFLRHYALWHTELDAFVWLEPLEIECVRIWRAEAETAAIAAGNDGMSPAQMAEFVEHFLPAYARYYPGLRNRRFAEVPYLHVIIGRDRLPAAAPEAHWPKSS